MKTMYGIEYSEPNVYVLQKGSLGVAEYAARTAYDSFEASEHAEVSALNKTVSSDAPIVQVENEIKALNSIESSELLDKLVWAYHHESVVEHINISFLIQNISRGVLQELARHRIASYTVRSTRYTMSPILNAFNACVPNNDKALFLELLESMKFLIVEGGTKYIEIKQIWDKLQIQLSEVGLEEFQKLSLSKEGQHAMESIMSSHARFLLLQSCKQKRNVGDPFKWIVTDNWSVDLVMTFNLRSLKNFIQLRDSGAAYFQIQWLANAIKNSLPKEFLNLIKKESKCD